MKIKKKILLITVFITMFIISGIIIIIFQDKTQTLNDTYTDVIGYIEHGAVKPNVSVDNKLLPFEYNGGEFALEYYLHTEGAADDIGLMVFIDGKIVGTRLGENEEYKYCNFIELNAGGETYYNLILSFIPSDLNEGETYSLDIVSLYNPSFEPDMVSSVSYGIFHSALASNYTITYNEKNKKQSTENQKDLLDKSGLISCEYSYEQIADTLNMNDFGVAERDSDKWMQEDLHCALYVNDVMAYDNCRIEGEQLHITYKVIGAPGIEYENTFFVNHQPVMIKSATSVIIETKEEQICVVDLYINTDYLTENSTFYIITIPKNSKQYDASRIGIYKTPSIWLYR